MTTVRVQISGITNLNNALAAIEAGADALGFVFYEKSPRYVDKNTVFDIVCKLPPFVATVSIFVDESATLVADIARFCRLTAVQLHGKVDASAYTGHPLAAKVIRAFRVRSEEELNSLRDCFAGNRLHEIGMCIPWTNAVLLDFSTGWAWENKGEMTIDFRESVCKTLQQIKSFYPLILAGGLTPQNVGQVVTHVRPYAVDVIRGIEQKEGETDPELVKQFIAAAKGGGLRS